MQRRCAWCSNDAVGTGGEHIWDAWLNKVLPETRYRAAKHYTIDSPVIHYDSDSIDEKLPVVCTTCNNGWMSTLSLKAKDRFERTMLEGEPLSLGKKDAAVLAAFVFMKAVVTNYAAVDESEPFFTRAARERFRKSLTLPPLLKMWFARFQGESRISLRSRFSIFGTNNQGPLYGIEFGSFTYLVGRLALQMLASRWKHLQHRGRPIVSLTPNPYWDQATTRFHPHNGEFLVWPPSKWLADDTLQMFSDRFGSQVNVPIRR